MPNKVEVAALSDVGCVRTNNEDSFGYDPDRQVYVVCDGMGGMASGEVASQMAVSTFLQVVSDAAPATPIEAILNQAIVAANSAVHEVGLQPAHKGMGTTLVAACIEDSKLFIGNVGDSRAYLIQGHQCMQITVDHSYINELIRTGVVKVEDAGSVDLKGMQSVITRAIGVSAAVDPDFFSADLTPGDIVLLASDGLTRYIEQKELGLIIGACDLESSARNMIAVAKERGGTDNITVLLLQLVAEAQPNPLITNAELIA
ncbi:Stp1/IreP family PP2C-type Ser/Thr phosphatase [Granulicella tundricola]|uniref:Protein serine/threonine phosphatase n=1 Tax=Granulicella tundricola (strain ATCC BAA-1859 / DSM 23138 / MP5ACTX9) TaxID=1198114 RepID=E8X5S4_GRATM|nr:Stp1/IreP family PP2C-type Ser/Thr phosphatase [Granulicella tundricola]ADW70808.1 protein serine/threonine phosphatase [Granulicella tundricola MP5ACTX9]